MPLFISSSESRYWVLVALLAIAVWALGVGSYDLYLRKQGHESTVVDSQQLWAQERSRVYGPKALVFAGASRTLYGIDLTTVGSMLPDTKPVMLALNGRYPIATLRALAEDEQFIGTLMLDVDARGLSRYNWDAQLDANDYFKEEWTPNWAIHRWLLNCLQADWVVLNPRLGPLTLAKSWITDAPLPFVGHDSLSAHREGYLDFQQANTAGLAEMFRVDLQAELERHPPEPPAKWLAALSPVVNWVKRIQARNGRVIFIVPPVSGHQATYVEAAYPRALYWQQFIDEYELMGWHYQDAQDLFDEITLPDSSHVDASQKPVYTERLINELRHKGLL